MKPIAILLIGLMLAGCGVMEAYTDVGRAIFQSKEERKTQQGARLNKWLGKTKTDRIQAVGFPDQCSALQNGGELCEWRFDQGETRVLYTYNSNGVATAWRANTSLGLLSSEPSTNPEKDPR